MDGSRFNPHELTEHRNTSLLERHPLFTHPGPPPPPRWSISTSWTPPSLKSSISLVLMSALGGRDKTAAERALIHSVVLDHRSWEGYLTGENIAIMRQIPNFKEFECGFDHAANSEGGIYEDWRKEFLDLGDPKITFVEVVDIDPGNSNMAALGASLARSELV